MAIRLSFINMSSTRHTANSLQMSEETHIPDTGWDRNLSMEDTLALSDGNLEDLLANMQRPKEELFSVILEHFDRYVLPVIILVGIGGNLTSFTGRQRKNE